MKALLFIFMLLQAAGTFAKDVPLTINWKFSHIVDGYDHTNKIKVYVDEVYKGESATFVQSVFGDFSVNVSKGKHSIKIVNYCLYEGKWEEHTIANEYSVDAVYEEELIISKASKLQLIWDIDGGPDEILITSGKQKKAEKPKKTTGGSSVIITWEFKGVIEGYDHDNRINVYVNDKLAGTSDAFKQTKKGTYELKLAPGTYAVKVENYAFYEGKWEIQNRLNDYSIDAFLNTDLTVGKTTQLEILFDIDKEVTTFEIK